jgi:hypothetical protein
MDKLRTRGYTRVVTAGLAVGAVGIAAVSFFGAPSAFAQSTASTFTIAPNTIVVGTTNSLAFAFTPGRSGSHTLSFTLPKGFSAPTAAELSTAPGSCTSATASSSGRTVSVAFNCAAGDTFTLTDSSVVADVLISSANNNGVFTITPTTNAGTVTTPPTITVTVGATSQFGITGLASSVDAFVPTSFTVSAEDAGGNVTTGYTGTVAFSSTDTHATLPAKYTFTGANNGTASFTADFGTPGSETLAVAQTPGNAITGQATTTVVAPSSIVVAPAAAVLTRGQTQQYTDTVTFPDATTYTNLPVTWSTSTLTGLPISKTGLATAQLTGSANISATLAGKVGKTTASVVASSTTTTLTSGTNPSVPGQPVTLSATVAPVGAPAYPGVGYPTGTVTFYNGSTSIGSATLTDSVGTLTVSTLPAGTDVLTATYSGDANNTTSTSAQLNQTVATEATTTTVTSSASSGSAYGQSVTFTATVAPATPYTAAPVGVVEFLNSNNQLLWASAVGSNGQATYTTNALTPGDDTVTAIFTPATSGSSTSNGSVVQAVSQATTSLTATSTGATSYGQAATIDVTVNPTTTGPVAPTGTVTVSDANGTEGTGTVTNGTATVTLNAEIAPGTDNLTVTYSGDSNYAGSNTTATQTVSQAGTTVSATSTGSTTQGQAATIDVTVTPSTNGGVAPTGTVEVTDANGFEGAAQLSNGSAAVTLNPDIPAGTDTLTVSYLGDTNYTGSQTTVNQQINGTIIKKHHHK